MFTKKLEDQFSADLLNTVRSILGEAKHDKECECEKCEEEDEDEEDEAEEENGKKKMKEGFASAAQRKAVWATYADGGKGHPDKKKKMKKEEVELEEGKMKELVTKHMDAGHDYDAALKKAKKDLEKMKNEEVEQIDELSKKTLSSYAKKAINQSFGKGVAGGAALASTDKDTETQGHKLVNKAAKRMQGAQKAISKLTKEEQDFIDALNDAEMEQIDELSGATLGSYVAKSRKDEADRREKGIKTRDEIRKQTGLRVGTPIDRKLYSPTASRGAGQKMAMKKLTGQARVNAKEEFELEEGRGRPPKEGSPAWHAKQKQASDDMVSLGMQLRKAKSINKKVRFMDNKEHDIHPNHINRFEDHMAARRTSQEKAAFQKQAHKSHADFVKAVSAPVPKASKDTGEIVKYR